MNNYTKIILKWYDLLKLPESWRKSVIKHCVLLTKKPAVGTPMQNLLYALYSCEELHKKYLKKNIADSIFMDTIYDIVNWSENYFNDTSIIGLIEIQWLKSHIGFEIFKLGRLQFKFGKATESNTFVGIEKGENVIEVHIPQNGKFDDEQCQTSYEYARIFFKEKFPEYKFKFFTCHSWLLDFTLKDFLKPESNIIKFQSYYNMISYTQSYEALKYLKLNQRGNGESYLETTINRHIKEHKKLYSGYGVIEA